VETTGRHSRNLADAQDGNLIDHSDVVLPRTFPRGQLRRLRSTDLAAFQAYRSIPELAQYQGWSPMPEAEAAAFLAEMSDAPLFAQGKWVQLGIADPEGDHLVGDIGIFVSEDGATAEIGFTLAPAAQGRGIATAAVREALQVLFAATEVQRVLGITDRRNAASVRLLERVGFQYQESRTVVFRGESCLERVYILLNQ
jgi:[ribosomal protein S5]-alanine N-acetyltransferase